MIRLSEDVRAAVSSALGPSEHVALVAPAVGCTLVLTDSRLLLVREGASYRPRSGIRSWVLDRTLKGGDSLESADVTEISAQFLYRQQDMFFFMDKANYEQYELTKDQVDDAWKYLKEGMDCQMVLYNNNPISVSPPNHVVLKIDYCEPAVRGNTATNLTKPVKLETGAEILCPAFVEIGDFIKVDTRTGEYLERAKG